MQHQKIFIRFPGNWSGDGTMEAAHVKNSRLEKSSEG